MFLSNLAGDVYAYLHTHASAFTTHLFYILHFDTLLSSHQDFFLLSAPLIKKKPGHMHVVFFSKVPLGSICTYVQLSYR